MGILDTGLMSDFVGRRNATSFLIAELSTDLYEGDLFSARGLIIHGAI